MSALNNSDTQQNVNRRRGGLSVIIPAYNEATRITATLSQLIACAPKIGISEIIVVDDGSTDQTSDLVAERAAQSTILQLVRMPNNQGKGAAVQTGVQNARGNHVMFLDADLSASPTAIPHAIAAIESGADIVIGTRVNDAGIDARTTQPLSRQLSGKIFSLLQRMIVGLKYTDTQCPFKLFTHSAAENLFPQIQTSGWTFDVELLARAQLLGLTVKELPVEWTHIEGSHIKMTFRAALAVIRELLSIRYRVR